MIKFPTIYIKVIPVAEQRFTTLGDWFEIANGTFQIILTQMADWRHIALVLIHELTELMVCWQLGVTTREADDFDALWEEELAQGLHRVEEEAGFDKRCPYRKGHVWGSRMERLFAYLLKVKWRDYCRACDEQMRQYQNSKP